MRKVLVTGGAGFIGSNLCERLIQEGNEVTCLDNFYNGYKNNIAHLTGNPFFKILNHDITIPFSVEVDEIYNLACPASPVQYLKDPLKTIKTSLLGSLNALNLAEKLNAKILQASTSEVYGDSNLNPQPENYFGNIDPFGYGSCYNEGKRCSETLFMEYRDKYGLDIKIVRLFNTYGPKMSPYDGIMVPNFIVKALKGENITVYGDGQQTKSFQFIDDLIEGLIRMIATLKKIKGPINLGNPIKYTVKFLAKTILNITGSTSRIIYTPLQENTLRNYLPDITLAKTCLNGWEPKVQLKEGLKRTIPSFIESLRSLGNQQVTDS